MDSQTIILPYHESQQCYTVISNTYPIWIQTRCRVFCLSGKKMVLSQTVVNENRYSLSRWKNCVFSILKVKIGFTTKISSLWLKCKSKEVTKGVWKQWLVPNVSWDKCYFDHFFKWSISMSVSFLLKWNGTEHFDCSIWIYFLLQNTVHIIQNQN